MEENNSEKEIEKEQESSQDSKVKKSDLKSAAMKYTVFLI